MARATRTETAAKSEKKSGNVADTDQEAGIGKGRGIAVETGPTATEKDAVKGTRQESVTVAAGMARARRGRENLVGRTMVTDIAIVTRTNHARVDRCVCCLVAYGERRVQRRPQLPSRARVGAGWNKITRFIK